MPGATAVVATVASIEPHLEEAAAVPHLGRPSVSGCHRTVDGDASSVKSEAVVSLHVGERSLAGIMLGLRAAP